MLELLSLLLEVTMFVKNEIANFIARNHHSDLIIFLQRFITKNPAGIKFNFFNGIAAGKKFTENWNQKNVCQGQNKRIISHCVTKKLPNFLN
jgi:hypothetical protein